MNPVFKFGGTSMGSLERIEHVAELCVKHRPSCVVVSAMAGETNRLVGLARGISERTDVPEYDMLVATGEQVSVALLSFALRKRGITPAPMLGSHAGIKTDSLFSRAHILSVDKEAIVKQIADGALPIIAGFQGTNEEGQFTSLGRGGSDTSAVAIAAGIGAKDCVIYTDVDGVFTTDPRISNSNAWKHREVASEVGGELLFHLIGTTRRLSSKEGSVGKMGLVWHGNERDDATVNHEGQLANWARHFVKATHGLIFSVRPNPRGNPEAPHGDDEQDVVLKAQSNHERKTTQHQ